MMALLAYENLVALGWAVEKLVLLESLVCASFIPIGIAAISRWLSEATPPETPHQRHHRTANRP